MELSVAGAQTLLRGSMSQEQRTALVQAHRAARRQLAALQVSRVSCRTVATELLSNNPSFRGCAPALVPSALRMHMLDHEPFWSHLAAKLRAALR